MIVELREKLQSATAAIATAEQGREEIVAQVAAVETHIKELRQIQVRLSIH